MHIRALAAAVVVVAGTVVLRADPRQLLTTEKILESTGARAGSTVCEVGAGDGAATIAAAKVVGPGGRVYSNELGDAKVKVLREAAERSGLTQITVVAAEITATNFPESGCDAVFMRDVYHHFSDPAAMNRALMLALKPAGRMALVDFTPPPDSEAPSAADRAKDGMHGVSAETMLRELQEAGFEVVGSEVRAQRWFMIVVAKPNR